MHIQMTECMNGQMDGQTTNGRQSDCQMHGWIDGQTNGQSDGWTTEPMNEWMSKLNERL